MTMGTIFVEHFFRPKERGSFQKQESPTSTLLI